MLARLAHVIVRRRRWVIGVWIVLTLFGGFSAGQVSKRWLTQFSIPGYSAYEANQQTLKIFGTGEQAPLVAVFHSVGRRDEGARDRERRSPQRRRATPARASASFFSTGSRAYVSKDRHTTFATIYPPECRTSAASAHQGDARGAAEGDAGRRDAST